MDKFGFTVSFWNEMYNDTPYVGWVVALPHQCDAWSISEAYSPVTQEQAIEDLEAFLAEGQAALEALKHGKEFGDKANL